MSLNSKKGAIKGFIRQASPYLAEFFLNKSYKVHGIKRQFRTQEGYKTFAYHE